MRRLEEYPEPYNLLALLVEGCKITEAKEIEEIGEGTPRIFVAVQYPNVEGGWGRRELVLEDQKVVEILKDWKASQNL
jgi:hypothetical protein